MHAEFLEQVGIVKYPPSLSCYAWEILNKYERPKAFEELQELDKKNWREDQEEKTGMILPSLAREKVENKPWEWRNWSRMYADERQKAFLSLQVSWFPESVHKQRLTILNRRESRPVVEELFEINMKT